MTRKSSASHGDICDISMDSQSTSDLQNALAQQLNKHHESADMTVGQWSIAYDLFADDEVDTDVLTEYLYAVDSCPGGAEQGAE